MIGGDDKGESPAYHSAMLMLAFDTCMGACSAAVYDAAAARVLAEACEEMERGHAERLAPMIGEVMASAGVEFSQLARVAVTRGPGTFTGIRIGLSMARGFGVALGIPVTGMSSLAAIAANATGEGPRAIAVDARGGEIYFALYDAAGQEMLAPCITQSAEAARLLPPQAVLLGSAAGLLAAAAGTSHESGLELPRASRFARFAAGLDPASHPPDPLYLRQPDIKPQYTVQRVDEAQLLAATLLAELHGESFDKAWNRDEFATLLAVPRTAALIISHGGEPTGFGLYRQAADEAEIITLAMRPAFRRRGLGRALLGEIERELRGGGAQALFLEVAASNAAARALYARSGFHEAGRRKDYYARSGGREDALVLRKTL